MEPAKSRAPGGPVGGQYGGDVENVVSESSRPSAPTSTSREVQTGGQLTEEADKVKQEVPSRVRTDHDTSEANDPPCDILPCSTIPGGAGSVTSQPEPKRPKLKATDDARRHPERFAFELKEKLEEVRKKREKDPDYR